VNDRGVRLVPYDALWPMMFEAEADRIEAACADLPLRLEHIGSTSVPGMSSKPVIDILAGRPPRSRPAAYIAAIRQVGYEHRGTAGIPGREFFRRGSPRTHHVHLVSWSSAVWEEHLLFRDLLRADPAIARDYEAVKRDLAIAFVDDRRAYTDGKATFIQAAIREARRRVV
jgi:GrpB-like predicted nucleotidyltransferase (UPF0157 family)